MVSVAHVRRQAIQNQTIFSKIWRWVTTTAYRVFFGMTEWEMICSISDNKVDETKRMKRFRTTLLLTTDLVSTANIVFDNEPFDVEMTVDGFTKHANLDVKNITLMANVRSCFHRCNYVNFVYQQVLKLKNEAYDNSDTKHEIMLEELWSSLKPNIRRNGGRITKEWGEIGFQGTDPMSDFRSMGILSLMQLKYFASTYSIEAQQVLKDSNHPTRWYPFAVTGINITAFIIELMTERLLDCSLYLASKGHTLQTIEQIGKGENEIHQLYCNIFTRFNTLWVQLKPRDVMEFPTIFGTLKKSIRKELRQQSFSYY